MGYLRTAFVVAVTAIVVVYVPQLFTKRLPVIVNGTTEPGFEEVLNTLRDNFEKGVEQPCSGSAFSAYYKGKKVVDIWAGYADAEALQLWREDNMAVVFSVTKGMAALCMAMLVDRGHLDYNNKVSDYWPEFAQNGKENVTVKMLLSHEAGLAMVDTTLSLRLLQDYEELGRVLARSPPIWEPGTAHGYHAITYGLYASQLLTHADPKKRTLGQFFKDEVAEPFDIEFYIGLPLELNYRVSRFVTGTMNILLMMMEGLRDPIQRAIGWEMYVTGDAILPAVIDNAGELLSNRYIMNDPDYRATESGSMGGIGTAEAVAKVYGILANGGKNVEGKMLLSKDTMAEMLAWNNTGKDKVLGIPLRNSNGIMFMGENQEMIGHPGLGGNMGIAILKHNLGVGYVSRYQSPYGFGNDPRFLTLQNALTRCIERIEAK